MATPQELAKVKALVNTGVSAEEAARQVKSDSFGISPDFIAKQQAKRQAKLAPTTPVDAINPAAPTIQMQADTAKAAEPVATVAPPVAQPVVPATMKEPVAPVAPKAEAPKFMTDVQRREQLGTVDKQASQDQMLANVDIMAKEDAGVLTDRAKFEAKTGYATKPPEEKAILDTYFKSNTPTTAGDIKKQLFAGVEIKDPKIVNTPAYRQAKFEKDRLSRYTGMSSEQLFNEMKSGLPTAASEALRGTPAYQEAMAKYDNYKKVDNINQTAKFIATGKSPEKDPLAELSNQLATIFNQQDQTGSTAEAYRTFISQNPEITEPTAEYNTKMAQKKEFERAREALVEDLKKKYAGEPLSTILAIAARESKPINDQINTLNDSLATLSADIKFKTDLATQEFGFFTQDQQAKAAKQAKLQDLLGNLAISQFGRQQDQAFEMQKMDIAQKYQADRDTQNYLQDLQKMGINNIYDLQKMEASQDFQKELLALNQKYADSKSVQDFNNELYKLGIAPPTATAPTAPGAVQYTPGGTDFTGLAAKYPRVAAFKNNNPAGITWNANFDKGLGTAKALTEAGIQFEKGTDRPAAEGGNYVKFNSIEDGLAAQRIMLEKTYGKSTVGSMLSSWVGTKEGPAYAKQVAGMAGISTTEKVSDLTPEQLDMLQLAKIKKESPGLYDELSNAGIVEGNTINFSKATPLSYQEALASEGVAGEFAKSLQKGTVTGMTGAIPKAENKELKKLAEYLIDTQPRGPGFSDEDAKAFTNSITKYANAGDEQTVYQLFRNKLMENKTVSEAVNDNASLIKGLSNLKGLLAEYKAGGDKTGLLTSFAETAARALGRTTNETLAQAQNQLGVLVADYIRAISGTAASDTEVARLLGNMPNIKNIDSLNTVILDNLESIAKNRVDATLSTQLGFKKDLAPKVFPEFYQNTNTMMSTPDTDYLKSLGY